MLVLRGRPRALDRLAWSPDGTRVAGGGSPHFGAEVWDAARPDVPPDHLPLDTHAAAGLGFAADGRAVVVNDHGVGVWSAAAGLHWRPVGAVRVRHADVSAAAGLAVVLAADPALRDHTLTAYRLGGPGHGTVAWDVGVGPGLFLPVAAFPAGDRVVHVELTSSRPPAHAVVVRDAATGHERLRFPTPQEAPHRVAVTADGRRVAVLDQWSVFVWDLADPAAPAGVLRSWTDRAFTGLAFDPAGRRLAVTCNDATVRVYDTGSWAAAGQFAWGVGRLRSVAYSPDGTRAAAGSDTGAVVVWDAGE